MNKLEQQFLTSEENFPEIPKEKWKSLIILQRHGCYDNNLPKDFNNISSSEEETLGRLTEDGIKKVRERTNERLDAIFDNKKDNVDFLLINSPTFWLDEEKFGQRAKETAEIISGEIKKYITEHNKNSHLLNDVKRENGVAGFKGEESRPEKKIIEAQMFQVPEFVNFLREEYGGQGSDFWRNFNSDTHKEVREGLGAEGPDDIAGRVSRFMKVVARFSNKYNKKFPNRKLVTWVVSHGDDIDPYVQKTFNIPVDSFSSGFNDGISLSVNEEGGMSGNILGKKYSTN